MEFTVFDVVFEERKPIDFQAQALSTTLSEIHVVYAGGGFGEVSPF